MHVVFVCWGNICRSPAAEAVFKKLLADSDIAESITCDSAGTIQTHAGNPPDSRMRRAAQARGIHTGGVARMITNEDYRDADLIITMDNFNFSEVSRMAPDTKSLEKIRPFCDFVESDDQEVPDPYYGGEAGFEKVLDLLEDGCRQILQFLKSKN